MMETGLNLVIATLAGWAAISDVRERRIPNWCCAAVAAVALAGAYLTGGATLAISSTVVALAAFAAAVVIYVLGMVGAGDAKLFAALALWVGAAQFAPFMAALAVATLLLSVWSIATRGGRIRVGSGGLAAMPKRSTLPLGLALSTGAIAAVYLF